MNDNVKKALLGLVVVIALGFAVFSASRYFGGDRPVDVATLNAGPEAMGEKERSMQAGGGGKEVDLSGAGN
jgi:hypothetical protein